jgi:hypothetical protein
MTICVLDLTDKSIMSCEICCIESKYNFFLLPHAKKILSYDALPVQPLTHSYTWPLKCSQRAHKLAHYKLQALPIISGLNPWAKVLMLYYHLYHYTTSEFHFPQPLVDNELGTV